MKYSIREFAELVGVSVDTLRLYEKHGIILPEKNKKNGYRSFNDFDARDMLMSRWYRSLELSITEARYLTGEAEMQQIIHRISRQKEQLEEELLRKKLLLEKITDITSEYGDIERRQRKCSVEEISAIYRITQTRQNTLLKKPNLSKIVEEWMKFLPFVHYSFHIKQKETSSHNDIYNYNWGLAIGEEDAKRLNIKYMDKVDYIPPARCVSSVITTSNDYLTKSSLAFMFQFMEEKGYEISGDIYGKIILTENSKTERSTCLEVNIPISDKII